MLSLNPRHIEYAIAIATYGSVSLAANAIHISQPALSVAIATLEKQLRRNLFIRRKGSPLVLTSFGRDFINRASDALDQFEMLAETDNAIADRRRPVVIGCYEDLAATFVGPFLAATQNSFPESNLSIVTGNFDFLSTELLAGRIDLSVSYNLGVDPSLSVHEIRQIRPHAILFPDHPLAAKTAIRIKFLATEPLVLVEQTHSIWHMINLFRINNLTPNIAHRAANYEIMRSLVGNGLGVGLSYSRSQSATSHDGKPLVIREIADPNVSEPIIISTNPENPLSSFGHLLTKLISQILNQMD